MPRNMSWSCRALALWAGLGLALCGCSPKEEKPPHDAISGQETVRGKVTYNGEPVQYGFVLFFNHQSMDPKAGSMRPAAVGAISPDGTYEMHHVPAGPMQVAIATDPDVDPGTLVQPVSPTGMGGPPGMPHGVPGGGPPIMPPPPVGVPGGGPGKAGPGPAGHSPAGHLPDATKRVLKTIHEKYGSMLKSKLMYEVRPGDQTHNFELK